MLATVVQTALGLVFPKSCAACKKPFGPGSSEAVCADCRAKIHPLASMDFPLDREQELDRILSCAAYEGTLRELIHSYKFERKKYLASFFGNLLLDTLRSLERPLFFDAVCAVPLDWAKFKERGFNQSQLLAKVVAQGAGVPELTAVFRRRVAVAPQSSLDKSARRTNVRNAFHVTDREPFKDKHLLLVDDIFTTGHTVSECARTLKKAGVKSVSVLTLSRGL